MIEEIQILQRSYREYCNQIITVKHSHFNVTLTMLKVANILKTANFRYLVGLMRYFSPKYIDVIILILSQYKVVIITFEFNRKLVDFKHEAANFYRISATNEKINRRRQLSLSEYEILIKTLLIKRNFEEILLFYWIFPIL